MTTARSETSQAADGRVALHRAGSALALDAQNAIKKGDPIGTYDAYAEWLASHPQGYLYLKQAISALAWQLHKTGNLPMMQKAVDEVMGAEREMVNEKLKAPNDQALRPRTPGLPSEPGVTD